MDFLSTPALGGGPLIHWGSGSPEAAVTAPVGSMYQRTDGGTNSAMYRKESGTGNTGWVNVTNAGAPPAWTPLTVALADGAGVADYEASVSDTNCTAASVIEVQLAPGDDGDENEPEFTNLQSATALPANGAFTLTLAFADRHSGPLKLQYRIN